MSDDDKLSLPLECIQALLRLQANYSFQYRLLIVTLRVTRIKELRLAKGFTQVEMSTASGLGQGYLSRVEAGSKRLSIDSLEAVAVALDMSLSELLKGV
jgi:Helix-turn-helix